MRKRAGGFTLIELLVVVAIIAILAAIAVPNFLAAQTRAKVSRCQADMRTLEMAAEMFRVDNNHYMYDNVAGTPDDYAWVQLTTPVAYLSTLTRSPFFENKMAENGGPYFEYWAGTWSGGLYRLDAGTQETGLFWRGTSGGPDNRLQFASGGAIGPGDVARRTAGFLNSLYDPTNGVISWGDLVVCNQGLIQ